MMARLRRTESTKSVEVRFPDVGPCEISNWSKFLNRSKKSFNEKWGKSISYKETLDNFKQIAILGSGSFGSVILIKEKEGDNYYAMKAIEKETIIKYKQLEHTKNEKMILQCINFPLTVYLVYFFKDNSYLYMVLPFITGGELFTHLRKFRKFDEPQAKFYVSQVILALEYLHYLDLIYRDLKPENILLDHTGYLKVTDFGFCRRLVKERAYTLCGTPEYLAPEILMSKGYGKSVDWWTIGVFIFELVSGSPPFVDSEPMKLYEKIITLKYKMPHFFTDDLKDLVKNILQVDLSMRYGNLRNGVDDIKNHKWFRTINWMAVLNRKVAAPYKPEYKGGGDTYNFDKIRFEPLKIAKENKFSQDFAGF